MKMEQKTQEELSRNSINRTRVRACWTKSLCIDAIRCFRRLRIIEVPIRWKQQIGQTVFYHLWKCPIKECLTVHFSPWGSGQPMDRELKGLSERGFPTGRGFCSPLSPNTVFLFFGFWLPIEIRNDRPDAPRTSAELNDWITWMAKSLPRNIMHNVSQNVLRFSEKIVKSYTSAETTACVTGKKPSIASKVQVKWNKQGDRIPIAWTGSSFTETRSPAGPLRVDK